MEPQLDVDDPGRVNEFLSFMSTRAAKQDVSSVPHLSIKY